VDLVVARDQLPRGIEQQRAVAATLRRDAHRDRTDRRLGAGLAREIGEERQRGDLLAGSRPRTRSARMRPVFSGVQISEAPAARAARIRPAACSRLAATSGPAFI
jgi:hypothetical protein